MKTSLPRSFLLAALTLGVPAFAADPLAKAAPAAPTTVSPVIVTASPIIDGNSVDRFGSYATAVSSEQVRDLNAVDLASALRLTPGVSISRFNPVGSFGDIEGGAIDAPLIESYGRNLHRASDGSLSKEAGECRMKGDGIRGGVGACIERVEKAVAQRADYSALVLHRVHCLIAHD